MTEHTKDDNSDRVSRDWEADLDEDDWALLEPNPEAMRAKIDRMLREQKDPIDTIRNQLIVLAGEYAEAGRTVEELRLKLTPDQKARDEENPSELLEIWGTAQFVAEIGQGGKKQKSEKARHRDRAFKEMESKHALAIVGGKTVVLTFRDGKTAFGTVADLHHRYANRFVKLKDDKVMIVSKWWMDHPQRKTYEGGVVFAPGKGEEVNGAFNLSRGWSVAFTGRGSCKLFLDHLYYNVCQGNEEHYNYLLGWMADLIQNPGRKPGVAVALRGKKGVGKDVVGHHLGRLMVHNYVHLHDQDGLTNRFNAQFEIALLVHAEEVAWAGDRKAENVLKGLITTREFRVERKGIDSFQVPSYFRLIVSSNSDWVTPATPDERRWFVLDVGEECIGDRNYFGRIEEQLEDGGYGALLHYLQNYDLTRFKIGDVPQTEALLEQKYESLREVEDWWRDMINRGTFPPKLQNLDTPWETTEQEINCDLLRDEYNNSRHGQPYGSKKINSAAFGKRLKAMLPVLERKRRTTGDERPWVYLIPPLPVCRKAFEAWINGKRPGRW